MKYLFTFLIVLILSPSWSQQIEGAWKLTHENGKPVGNKEYIKIYQDGYFAFGAKELGNNKFLGAGGGEFSLTGSDYTESLDFYTFDKDQIGTTNTYLMDFAENKLIISARIKGKDLIEIWEKISDRDDAINGTWVITGRKRDGELSSMTPGARRTVKILGGGRFQWIAFNSESKEFSGTGGGTYTAESGKYTENITFFSRDDSRVGASLGFDFEVIDKQWHHSGMSSTGNPIYEIWSSYQEAYLSKKQ